MTTKTLTIALVSLFLTACGTESETTKTVDYYKEHDADRKAKLTECENNPGELANTPNCQNAHKAMIILSSGSGEMDFTGYFKKKE